MVVQLILLGIKINGVGAIAALSWFWILTPLWIWIVLSIIGILIYLAIK
jgi:hypothetical protein